ncbi:MAG: hypothetical protein OQJ69_02450, partial [Flavobacteriales bacterium]|nr:hypothetical protein [Flavobacteriales bacterium]
MATVFMAYQAQFARMSYEMAQILPKSDPTYKEYDKFKEIFGKDGSMVVVGIDNSNIYQLNNFNAWFDLTQDIKKIEVDFKKNGELIKVNGVTEALSVANAYTLKKNYESKKFDFNQIVQKKPSSQGEVDEIKKAI